MDDPEEKGRQSGFYYLERIEITTEFRTLLETLRKMDSEVNKTWKDMGNWLVSVIFSVGILLTMIYAIAPLMISLDYSRWMATAIVGAIFVITVSGLEWRTNKKKRLILIEYLKVKKPEEIYELASNIKEEE